MNTREENAKLHTLKASDIVPGAILQSYDRWTDKWRFYGIVKNVAPFGAIHYEDGETDVFSVVATGDRGFLSLRLMPAPIKSPASWSC